MKNRGLIWLLAVLVGGCSFVPPAPPPLPKSIDHAESAKPSDAKPKAKAKSPTTDGKYYLDDGPPTEEERLAAAAAKDAVVRWEPLMSSRNRPYVALGKRYRPYRHLLPYKKTGVASWYGRRYHGRPTASGEKYDMFQMTAAHPLLPIPSYVRVTRVSNGAMVVVRVNDRGPFLGGRLIDLSYAAAERLGYVTAGTAEVVVELLIAPETPAEAIDVNAPAVTTPAPVSSGVYIQLAAFNTKLAAENFLAEIQQKIPPSLAAQAEVYGEEEVFRVQLGAYATHEEAATKDAVLCGEYEYCGFLTQR